MVKHIKDHVFKVQCISVILHVIFSYHSKITVSPKKVVTMFGDPVLFGSLLHRICLRVLSVPKEYWDIITKIHTWFCKLEGLFGFVDVVSLLFQSLELAFEDSKCVCGVLWFQVALKCVPTQ